MVKSSCGRLRIFVPVKATTPKIQQRDHISRFLGDEVRVTGDESMVINNFVHARWLDVLLAESDVPEDQGKLFLFPIDDHKFSLQLCYLQYADNSGMNATAYILHYLPSFFDQYPPEQLMHDQPFRFDQSTELQFPVCSQTRLLLAGLSKADNGTPFVRALQQSEVAMQLLRRALECITMPFNSCQVPACRFLAFETERDKIAEARQVLENNIDRPLTIRELSRKVAMNECYLKKGFKALTGKTIHDYQQDIRIARAKELLQQHISVTEVANTLGYSSISHFSTAFKRVTGMKPCELLS